MIDWLLTYSSVEDLLLRLARSGQIQKKVSEQELIGLLDQLSQQESKANKTKIVVSTFLQKEGEKEKEKEKEGCANRDASLTGETRQ